jgi:hypothetical protein
MLTLKHNGWRYVELPPVERWNGFLPITWSGQELSRYNEFAK